MRCSCSAGLPAYLWHEGAQKTPADRCLVPAAYIKHFKGPHFGNDGIREMMKVYDRPLTGAVPKPKIGFTAQEHAEIAYETWMGGFDFVKDDENLTSTSFTLR